MNKQLIATMIAAGLLLALQAPAFAQLGSTSFALPNVQSTTVGTMWNSEPHSAYYDNAAPKMLRPCPSAAHQGHHRHR